MSEKKEVDLHSIDLARQYLKALEEGNTDNADEILTEITDVRESQLFNELGRLTRDFHEAINSFNSDERISQMAEDDIPDAKQRLNYVIEKTDEAANKTLNAVENAIPVCEQLEVSLDGLNTGWEKFLSREMKPDEFRVLSNEIKEFLHSSGSEIQVVKANLNEILMAQDFQDITGQIIKRVITLVGEVESNLVELIRLNSKVGIPTITTKNNEKADIDSKEAASVLDGPQIPGMETEGAVSGQDDVDELLSSLGF